jgi:hypothetical protein
MHAEGRAIHLNLIFIKFVQIGPNGPLAFGVRFHRSLAPERLH